MPASPSGEVRTITVRAKQKNGDTYILERQIQYDSEKKYNKVISTKLISKILKGTEEIVPTRPKRKCETKEGRVNPENKGEEKTFLIAERKSIGMMKILEHIGEESGIDDALYASFDKGTAQKIISLSRYFIATNGQSCPGIVTWQLTHPIPYRTGFTENIYHELFFYVGRNETGQQNFFKIRSSNLENSCGIAYDSTTISTYSENLSEARYGFNKDGDGLKTIKILTLYSIDNLQPIAFSKQSGNIPDVITIKNAIHELSAIGVNIAEIVTDNGCYSNSNIAELLYYGYNFITLVQIRLKWVKEQIDIYENEFNLINTICYVDPSVHCVTVKITQTFTRDDKNISEEEKKLNKEQSFSKELYLHLYFSSIKQAEERLLFDSYLIDLKNSFENKKIKISELNDDDLKNVNKYLNVIEDNDNVVVTLKESSCANEYKYHGYFALVSNNEKSASVCLKKYRKRNTIESSFRYEKNVCDGKRPRVRETYTLRGRLFVQFVALCYYEYYLLKITNIKKNLGVKNSEKKHDSKENLKRENSLKSWLENTPIYIQLQWFDAIENVEVSTEIKSRKWDSSVISRDKLFLEKLGIDIQ